MVKEPNGFYVFITNVKLGDRLFVPKSTSFTVFSAHRSWKYMPDYDTKNQFSASIYFLEGEPMWFWTSPDIMDEMVNGALMMRGFCLSEPKFYDKEDRDLEIELERSYDDDYETPDLVSYIEFAVLEWKPPQ